MKKNDIILMSIILIAGGAFFLFWFLGREEGSKVLVTVDGQEYKTYNLDEDIIEVIDLGNGNYNTLKIHDGYVSMEDASCPDHICVKHRDIHFKNETITCLPNKVVLQILGGQENEVDFSVK